MTLGFFGERAQLGEFDGREIDFEIGDLAAENLVFDQR